MSENSKKVHTCNLPVRLINTLETRSGKKSARQPPLNEVDVTGVKNRSEKCDNDDFLEILEIDEESNKGRLCKTESRV